MQISLPSYHVLQYQFIVIGGGCTMEHLILMASLQIIFIKQSRLGGGFTLFCDITFSLSLFHFI